MSEEVIFPESPEAAQHVTVQGWVSRDGRFWGDDEQGARVAGSTHYHCCDCNGPAKRPYAYCESCRANHAIDGYQAMPKQVWDGTGMIYSEKKDTYYDSLEYAEDDLETGETLADLRLVICEPVMAHTLDSDVWCDELPEDGKLPPALEDALAALNAVIAALPPLSYMPGKIAVALVEGGDGG